jgi:hypothetical protein
MLERHLMATLRMGRFASGLQAKSQRVAITSCPGACQRRFGLFAGGVGANDARARQGVRGPETGNEIGSLTGQRECMARAP